MFTINFKGKTVLITGADSGIGFGVSQQMAKAGANVSGCAIASDGDTFLEKMNSYGVEAIYTSCDVKNEEHLQQLVRETVDKFGGIDILVSNAGQNVFTGALASSMEDWQHNIDLNLASHWHLAKLCKPYIEKNKGVIIIMSSTHAYSSISGCFPYNVAKTALTGLVRSLAIEWGPTVRTVGIAPGFIDTPGNQKWFDSFPDPQKERERTIDKHPVKKLGTVEEIGAWCVFLASNYAAFASGTTYLVDGGMSALMR